MQEQESTEKTTRGIFLLQSIGGKVNNNDKKIIFK